MAVIYKHLKPCGEVFYIGIGQEEKRAKSKSDRNNYWHNVVNKYGYEVQILKSDLTWEDACELEKILISYYGRKDNNTGILSNMTNGGDGSKGFRHTKEFKEELKIRMTNRKISDKTRLKMSESAKNRPKRNYSEEHKLNISKGNKGKKRTKEQLIKLSKKVINTETNIIYECVQDAADFLNIKKSTLINYLSGFRKNKTTMKYLD